MLMVSGEDNRLVLIDGYQCHAVLTYLGQDAGLVRVVDESERQGEAIEKAGLIQELHRRFSYSLSEIGKRIGRDKSYVKRRMDLLEPLPQEIFRPVRKAAERPV